MLIVFELFQKKHNKIVLKNLRGKILFLISMRKAFDKFYFTGLLSFFQAFSG